ncbi:lanthionine synthetase LanC family protein [Actinocorallia libanotica]|uniref:Lanthionine synthetase-like protein n=1 Tax=Actinocorallia libanotica TaxID=46162 RepID=A0ABN1RYF6_9ACTN
MSIDLALTIAERFLTTDAAAIGGAGLSGLAGTALLHARLSHLDPTFARAAALHWESALRTSPRTGSSIHQPAGGVAASLILGNLYLPASTRQSDIVSRAVRWLSAQASATAQKAANLPQVYDAINGLAATGRVLLSANVTGYPDAESGLRAALKALTAMILDPRSEPRPGWWILPEHHLRSQDAPRSGAADTGLAHGIAGPLALLAAALRADREVPLQADAIERAAEWLVEWQTPNSDWPPEVTGEEMDTGERVPLPGRRDAWCYGTPGITNALRTAANVLNRPAWTRAADDALKALDAKPAWDVEGPDICHGHAGILVSVPRSSIAHDRAYSAMTTTLIPKAPGVLFGAVGVALALTEQAEPRLHRNEGWQACLLLSPA